MGINQGNKEENGGKHNKRQENTKTKKSRTKNVRQINQ